MANRGDYICVTNNMQKILVDLNPQRFGPEVFEFTWKEGEVHFGTGDHFFTGMKFNLIRDYPDQEIFHFTDTLKEGFFKEGRFFFSLIDPFENEIISITANCPKRLSSSSD